jgi:hypothetical protein
MNNMSADLARVLHQERVADAALRQRRIDARRGARQARKATAAPRERVGSGLLARLVLRTGVRVSTR